MSPTSVAIDWTWLLLIVPLVFGLGWFFSRLDIVHWRLEARHNPKAYFRGLNHLLAGRQDRAVEEFIAAVQNDPDTAELHFTLGNLFRQRGEYAQATRVHQHLLARGDLSAAEHLRARFALAQDYWRAGILDRAESVLEGMQTPEAQQLLLVLYERGREWQKALQLAQELQGSVASHDRQYLRRIAHYLCEQKRFDEAMAYVPGAPRAYIEKARDAQSTPEQAHALLLQLLDRSAQAASLVAHDLLRTAVTSLQKDKAAHRLEQIYEASQDLDILRCLVAHGYKDANGAMRAHALRNHSLSAIVSLVHDEQLRDVVDKLVLRAQRYRCASCGFEAQQHFWLCPGCQAWDSFPMQKLESQ